MKINMANWDRLLRVPLAASIAALYFSGTVEGTWGIVLLVLATICLASSVVGVCPLYTALGFSTRRRKDAAAH